MGNWTMQNSYSLKVLLGPIDKGLWKLRGLFAIEKTPFTL